MLAEDAIKAAIKDIKKKQNKNEIKTPKVITA